MPEKKNSKGDFLQQLRLLDGDLAQKRISMAADRRLRDALAGSSLTKARHSMRWIRPMAWSAAVAIAAGAFWFLLPGAPQHSSPKETPPTVAGFQVMSGLAVLSTEGEIRCQTSQCALLDREVKAHYDLHLNTVIQRRGPHLRLIRGQIRCQVKPGRATPLEVLVSHGSIEVLGTIFSLRQGDQQGEVTLERGSIRFNAQDGRHVVLKPGDNLRWPLPPLEEQHAVKPQGPATSTLSPPRVLSAQEIEHLHQQIAELRNRGLGHRASKILKKNLPRISPKELRATWSFELGDILLDDLGQIQAACQHWRWHLRTFGEQQYGPEIKALLKEKCQRP